MLKDKNATIYYPFKITYQNVSENKARIGINLESDVMFVYYLQSKHIFRIHILYITNIIFKENL
jgi:hypothetical protein